MTTDITVVVPAFNAGKFLGTTLATVAAQTLQPVEIVIADDGSTDDTAEVAEAFGRSQSRCPARVLREPHSGPGAARNAGVRAATTRWIAFLDSDDLWHPDKLLRIAQAIRENPHANLFCHNEVVRFQDGSTRTTNYAAGFDLKGDVPRQLYLENHFSTSAVTCLRSVVLEAGGFDETLTSAQDYELWLRMAPSLVPVFIPEALGTYILREGNITTTRYWRRLGNGLRVKHRHRQKGGLALYISSVLRLTLVHLLTPATRMLKRAWRRSSK